MRKMKCNIFGNNANLFSLKKAFIVNRNIPLKFGKQQLQIFSIIIS